MPLLLPALAALLAGAGLSAFAATYVTGLWRPDAFDYAQIARELHAGNGFTTRQAIYLLHLEFLQDSGSLQNAWPNLHRFPLPSLAIAASYGVFGVGTVAVVASGIFFHALTAGLIFGWGRQVGGLPLAAGSWLLVTANASLLETTPSGLAEAPEIFFFTLSLVLLWRFSDQPASLGAILSGAALGLAALSRTNALFAAPALLACVAVCSPARARHVAAWLSGAVLVLLPWLVRNALVTGDPLFSLHSYFLLPAGTGSGGGKWDIQQPWVTTFVSPATFLAAHPSAVLAKWLRNGATLALAFPTLGKTFLLPVLAALPLLPIAPLRTLRGPALVLFAAFVSHALLVSFTDIYFDKYHFQFLPPFMLLAAATLWTLSSRVGAGRIPVFALGILLTLHLPSVFGAGASIQRQTARFNPEQLAFVRANTQADDIVLSDHSYAVTWETGRRSVRTHYDALPNGDTVLATRWIEAEYLPIDAIYLSREFTQTPQRRRALQNTIRQDPHFQSRFPAVHEFEDGALFFSSKPR